MARKGHRDPIASAVRQAKRARRIGIDAACVLCGYCTPESLLRVDRTLLERHHVAGRANDADLTVVVCRNCHGELTETLRDAGVSMEAPPNTVTATIQLLRGLAVLCDDLAHSCRRHADELKRYDRKENSHE